MKRVQAEQAEIESRLLEVDGMEKINSALKKTKIKGEGDMEVDETPEPVTSRTIEAKKRALAQYVSISLQWVVDDNRSIQSDPERY